MSPGAQRSDQGSSLDVWVGNTLSTDRNAAFNSHEDCVSHHCDSRGARTHDPILKRDVLYLLS